MLSGIGNGIALVCNALLVQRGAPDRLRGRVFTVLMSSNYAVLGLGMIVAGPLTMRSARAGSGASRRVYPRSQRSSATMARGIRDQRVVEAQRVAEPV